METWCNENGIATCMETSAKNASNVQEAFATAVEHWLKAESRADKADTGYSDTVDLSKVHSDSRSSCCASSSSDD